MNANFGDKNKGIQVVSRAAAILRALGEVSEGQSLGQIARRVNLPRSTVQRIVAALAAEGFISTEDRASGLRLGPAFQSLTQASARDTKDRLRPIMRRISEDTGETVDLAILDGRRMLFIDQIDGGQRLRAVSSIGDRFPLSTTANGKAALACLDEAAAARMIIAEMENDTQDSRSLTAVLREIEDIRQGALARDENEHTEGISALGFALKDNHGDVYAISIPVPSSRFARLKSELTDVLQSHRRTEIDVNERP